ncbi:Protein DEK [Holothuria leucospilota]|uniref:Protein DEK n=1 Tax=Holothuria leucospilota TaxID=206669 RepID=A0A9Q1BUI2_HOLLE|nr:Protein DEK [Holothuria leucospilota]
MTPDWTIFPRTLENKKFAAIMATTEPKENPVQNEGTAEEKVTPVKEVKQNGQDGDSSDVSPAKSKSDNEEKETEDNHKAGEQGQDEADQEMEQGEEKTKEEDDDEDEDEEEESSDDEPQKGSLDGPVQIMTGKRERKKVERLAMQSPPEKEKEKFEIKDGRGAKLGDCPMIEFQLGKTNADMLKPLYRILFGRIGKVTEIKKHIRKFSGFTFTKEDSDFEKKEIQLNRFTLAGLKELCTWLALEKGGTKEDIIQRILEFCLMPTISEKKLPVKKKKAPKKTATKRKKASAKADAKGDAKKKKKKKVSKSKASVDDEDDVDEEDEIIDEEADSDLEEEEPKKKKAKKETPKSPKKPKAKTPQKKSSPKKATPKKSAPKVEEPDSDSSSDDDAPLSKKSNSPPSESEIRTVITKFLDGANLEQVTMKTVCKKVYETYPDFDLTHKKDFIKSTVKEIIST